MKRSLKAALAAVLALVMALTVTPVSALPKVEAEKTSTEPCWTVPAGYNVHDYTKCVEFLEQTDENGVKNGYKMSSTYDPNDPETWESVYGWMGFRWREVNGEMRLFDIDVDDCTLCGSLDVSECTALAVLYCGGNNLIELDVSGCTALEWLFCYYNNLAELDVSGCTALEWLHCNNNNLTALNASDCTALEELFCNNNNLTVLDVSGCTALEDLDCLYNNLAELDVSDCTALEELRCYYNNLTELDLSNNLYLPYDYLLTEGNGHIGYAKYYSGGYHFRIHACPMSGASFDGFYDESGALISAGEWSYEYEAYIYIFSGTSTGTVIARFSDGEAIPGDINGDGTVSILDALITLRIAMQMLDGSGMNIGTADMDGNGAITVEDALEVLRVALEMA